MGKLEKNKPLPLIAGLIVMELVFGGAGRLVTIGPISERYLLFGLAMIVYVIYGLRNGLKLRSKYEVMMLVFLTILALEIINGIFRGNDTTAIFATAQGYLYWLILLPMLGFINSKNRVLQMWKYFDFAALIVAIVIVGIFLYLTATMVTGYNQINPFLIERGIGFLDFVDGFPRVFFKVSPLIAAASIHQLVLLFNAKGRSALKIINFSILLVASIVSFTIGIWIALIVGFFMVIILMPGSKKIGALLGITLLILFVVYTQQELLTVLETRTGSDDVSGQIKGAMLQSMLQAISGHFVIGWGFGKMVDITTVVGIISRTQFELSYLQVWLNTGLVGLISYLTLIMAPIKDNIAALKMMKKEDVTWLISPAVGLTMVLVVSLVNPFITNPIGIGYAVLVMVSTNVLTSDSV